MGESSRWELHPTGESKKTMGMALHGEVYVLFFSPSWMHIESLFWLSASAYADIAFMCFSLFSIFSVAIYVSNSLYRRFSYAKVVIFRGYEAISPQGCAAYLAKLISSLLDGPISLGLIVDIFSMGVQLANKHHRWHSAAKIGWDFSWCLVLHVELSMAKRMFSWIWVEKSWCFVADSSWFSMDFRIFSGIWVENTAIRNGSTWRQLPPPIRLFEVGDVVTRAFWIGDGEWRVVYPLVISGKHTKNDGKIHHFWWLKIVKYVKSTISTGPFSIANC